MRQDCCAWRTAAASQPKDPSGQSILDVGGTGNAQLGQAQGIVGRCWPVGSLSPARGQTISLIHPPVPAPEGLFNGLIWPKDGCASSAYATTAGPDFLPLPTPTPRAARDPGSPSFLAQQQSRACAVLRCAAVAILAPSRERDGDPEAMWRRSPPASRSPSRPQWCGLRRQDGDGTWPPSAPSKRPAPTSSPATS